MRFVAPTQTFTTCSFFYNNDIHVKVFLFSVVLSTQSRTHNWRSNEKEELNVIVTCTARFSSALKMDDVQIEDVLICNAFISYYNVNKMFVRIQ